MNHMKAKRYLTLALVALCVPLSWSQLSWSQRCCSSGIVRAYHGNNVQVQRFPYAMSAVVTQIMES